MSDEIMKTLLEIRGDLGEIKGALGGHVKAFDEHVKLDMQAYKAIGDLKTDAAKQKGLIKGVGIVGSIAGAALGYIAEKLLGLHH